jgi:hypothetical protein
MASVSLTSALSALRDIGRARVFYAVTAQGGSTPLQWDGTTELFLKWLCDTEGAVAFEPNPEFQRLTAPELTGAAPLRAKVQGEAPTITIPAVYASPTTRALLSPTGSASGGYPYAIPVTELTLVIFAEELFFDATAATAKYGLALDPNGGTWQLGGQALSGLSARKQALFGLTTWAWRCFAIKAPFNFAHEDHGKNIQEVTVELMVDETKPEGHMLYTIGDPYTASIDIEGAS